MTKNTLARQMERADISVYQSSIYDISPVEMDKNEWIGLKVKLLVMGEEDVLYT